MAVKFQSMCLFIARKRRFAQDSLHGTGQAYPVIIECTLESTFLKGVSMSKSVIRPLRLSGLLLLLALSACAGQRAEQEALMAQQEAAAAQARAMAERAQRAEAARLAAEQSERELRAELERVERERSQLAQARAETDREAAARARQAAALQTQQEADERARMHREQTERIAALERQIADADARIQRREQANVKLSEAITAAEELLQMLASEQLKYENVDAQGQTVEPLQKSLISELETRKDTLVREAEQLGN